MLIGYHPMLAVFQSWKGPMLARLTFARELNTNSWREDRSIWVGPILVHRKLWSTNREASDKIGLRYDHRNARKRKYAFHIQTGKLSACPCFRRSMTLFQTARIVNAKKHCLSLHIVDDSCRSYESCKSFQLVKWEFTHNSSWVNHEDLWIGSYITLSLCSRDLEGDHHRDVPGLLELLNMRVSTRIEISESYWKGPRCQLPESLDIRTSGWC